MNSKKCKECNSEFTSNVQNKIFCSKECSKKFNFLTDKTFDINTSQMGSISELMVAVDYIKKGYTVYRPLNTEGFADLIVFKKGKRPMYLEVRTAYFYGDGKLRYTKNLRIGNGIPTHYALYIAKQNKIIIIPIKKELVKKYAKK